MGNHSTIGINPSEFTPPVAANFCLAATHIGISAFMLFGMPVFVVPRVTWWPLILVLSAASITPLWALLHECIHGTFHRGPKVNTIVGRGLAILCYGACFRIVAVGHLLHHKHNFPEGIYGASGNSDNNRAASFGRYFRLFTSPYLLVFLSNILVLLPIPMTLRWFEKNRVAKAILTDKLIAQERLDSVLVLIGLSVSVWLYGANAWAVALIVLVRCILISFLDGLYHFQPQTFHVLQGFNLRLHPVPQALILNFNLHGVHHAGPKLPWNALPEVHQRMGGRYDGDYFGYAIRQLGPEKPAPRDDEEAPEVIAAVDEQISAVL